MNMSCSYVTICVAKLSQNLLHIEINIHYKKNNAFYKYSTSQGNNLLTKYNTRYIKYSCIQQKFYNYFPNKFKEMAIKEFIEILKNILQKHQLLSTENFFSRLMSVKTVRNTFIPFLFLLFSYLAARSIVLLLLKKIQIRIVIPIW